MPSPRWRRSADGSTIMLEPKSNSSPGLRHTTARKSCSPTTSGLSHSGIPERKLARGTKKKEAVNLCAASDVTCASATNFNTAAALGRFDVWRNNWYARIWSGH